MTDTVVIARDQWAQFFDQLSEEHAGELMKMELLDPDYGDQIEGEGTPFQLASYDRRNDMVIITAGISESDEPTYRRMIQHPSEIDVSVPDDGTTVVRVVGPADTTLVSFYPLA